MENFTVEDYEALKAKVISGELVIDDSLKNDGEVVDAGLENINILYE
jgi:hypothetical protein